MAATDIPTPAKITYAEDFTDETLQVLIKYTISAGIDNIQACMSFTGANDDIPYRDVPTRYGSYHFVLTDEERTTLRNHIKQGNSSTIRIYVKTTINGITYHSYLTKNYTLVNYEPSLEPVIIDRNTITLNLTGNNSKFIKYFSNAYISINAQANKGASIISKRIVNGSQTIEIEDREQDITLIKGVDSNTFYFKVQDSRGYETNSFKVVDFVNYIKLTSSLTLQPLTLAGDLTLVFEGNYFNGSFGAKNNTLEFEYGLQENGGDINWTIIDTAQGKLTLNGNTYRLEYTIKGLNPDSTYTITSNVIDELMNVQIENQSTIAKPVFDWGKTDFKHNTDVIFENKKNIIATRANGSTFRAIEPCNASGNTVINWDSYSESISDTEIYGNNVKIVAKEDVFIKNRAYGKNQVLWSGVSHMNGSQSASLTQKISDQPNGIVLVFSLYRNGAAEDVSMNSFFVSKKEVELLPNAPHTFFMMINSGFSKIGAKYLYIDDNKITGNATNSLSGANNGITYDNSSFVLRYVIGV